MALLRELLAGWQQVDLAPVVQASAVVQAQMKAKGIRLDMKAVHAVLNMMAVDHDVQGAVELEADPARPRGGVPDGVRHRFQRDPVRGHLHGGR